MKSLINISAPKAVPFAYLERLTRRSNSVLRLFVDQPVGAEGNIWEIGRNVGNIQCEDVQRQRPCCCFIFYS